MYLCMYLFMYVCMYASKNVIIYHIRTYMYRFWAARVRHPEEAPLLLQRRSEGSALQQQPGLQQPRTQPRPLGGGRLGHSGVAAGISRSRGGRYLHYIHFMYVCIVVGNGKPTLCVYVCMYVCKCVENQPYVCM